MEHFISQLEGGALRSLLARTMLKDTAMIIVGRTRHIENLNEEAVRLTGLRPMEQVDEILSSSANAALKDCIAQKVPHTVAEDIDDINYDLEMVPHREGALLAYMRYDRASYDGTLRIMQTKSAQYLNSILGISEHIDNKIQSESLKKQCLRMIRMLTHSDFLHEHPAPEQLKLKIDDICVLCEYSAYSAQRQTKRHIAMDMPGRCAAAVDHKLIRVAVYNLLANALQVTPADKQVSISVPDGAEFVTITVSDQGPGLDPERFEDLLSGWQRGVSLDEYRSLARERLPLGFGLPLIKCIAQLHGGTLFLSPREGGGSEFHMTIAKNIDGFTHDSSLHMPQYFNSGYSLEEIEFSVF